MKIYKEQFEIGEGRMILQHYKDVLEYLEVHSGLSMETTRNVWLLLGTLTAQVGQCESLSLFVNVFCSLLKAIKACDVNTSEVLNVFNTSLLSFLIVKVFNFRLKVFTGIT